MSTASSKPTPSELNQAKQIYNDVNDYLEYLAEIIQSQVQESDDEDEEIPSTALQFLKDYKEYISSPSRVHTQLLASDGSLSTSSSRSHTKRFWKYSQTEQMLQSLPPKLLADYPKLCETRLDYDVQASPSFSTFTLPTNNSDNEKLLTNDASPTVTLLKAQLEEFAKEQRNNLVVVRLPKYAPTEEKDFVFVVKKSIAAIVAPPEPVEQPKQPEPTKEKFEEKIVTETILSEKVKKKPVDFDLISSFLAITKVGFSKSQLSSLMTGRWEN